MKKELFSSFNESLVVNKGVDVINRKMSQLKILIKNLVIVDALRTLHADLK